MHALIGRSFSIFYIEGMLVIALNINTFAYMFHTSCQLACNPHDSNIHDKFAMTLSNNNRWVIDSIFLDILVYMFTYICSGHTAWHSQEEMRNSAATPLTWTKRKAATPLHVQNTSGNTALHRTQAETPLHAQNASGDSYSWPAKKLVVPKLIYDPTQRVPRCLLLGCTPWLNHVKLPHIAPQNWYRR
jgi:hypothetical protein